MPNPDNYSSKEEWLNACIPQLISEGKGAAQAVAICHEMWEGKGADKQAESKSAYYIGESIKDLGNGRIGGYLVRYSDADTPDLVGDFFTKETIFGSNTRPPLFYGHGYDPVLKNRIIGEGAWVADDVGLWYEAQLDMRDEYLQAVYELVKKGALGYSSGAVAHLVEVEDVKGARWIKTWIIGEASLTVSPAEFRNQVITVKNILSDMAPPVELAQKQETQERFMEENQTVTMSAEQLKGLVDQAVASALKALPPTDAAAQDVAVIRDAADQPWSSSGEFFKAVKTAALYPREVDTRLKATGMSEGVPSDGGYLVPVEMSKKIMERVLTTGEILSRVENDPVGGNSMLYNGVAETTHVGSLYGGIVYYWIGEANQIPASRPKFYQLDLKLKKIAALAYATDEQLEDTANLESWLNRTVPNVLRFGVEHSIVEGDGAGKPLGILNSPALIAVKRDTASTIVAADIAALWSRRWLGVSDYVWLIGSEAMGLIYGTTIGQMPVFVPPGGISASPYATLYGRPIIETEYVPAKGSTGDIVLASLSQYQTISKTGGVNAATSIHVAFVTDETAFRFTMRIDGAPSWHAPLTPLHGSTVSPFVALDAASS